MIDFHSHILPKIDDGSKSIDESLALLGMLSEQGISKVVATPHFYANHHSVDEFIERRNNSYSKLKKSLNNKTPQIYLGAEVKYYSGISRLDNLEKLCIEGTKLILIEMPFCKWTESVVREIAELSYTGKFKIILAHIERYLGFKNTDALFSFLDNDILLQVNASFFNGLSTRRKALKMLKNNEIHLIGSDCHNIEHRPPRIGDAYNIINRRLGQDFLQDINNFAESLLL